MARKSSELSGSFIEAPPLLLPDLKMIYARRVDRLIEHANAGSNTRHPIADYLLCMAEIVQAQLKVCDTLPFPEAMIDDKPMRVDWQGHPLSSAILIGNSYWQDALDCMIDFILPTQPIAENPIVQKVLIALRQEKRSTRALAAAQVLIGDVSLSGVAAAPFYWSALSLFAATLSRRAILDVQEDVGVARHYCPICEGNPVASIVTIGPPEGVRYLHCGLCDNEWRVVRAQCSQCEASGKLYYWSLGGDHDAIKAESCGDCQSYLKIVYQNIDARVEPVADDLASLAVDVLMEEKGFAKSAFNPFIFQT